MKVIRFLADDVAEALLAPCGKGKLGQGYSAFN